MGTQTLRKRETVQGSENLESGKDCALSPRTKGRDAEAESSRGSEGAGADRGRLAATTHVLHQPRCGAWEATVRVPAAIPTGWETGSHVSGLPWAEG